MAYIIRNEITMAVSQRRDWEFGSFSVYQVGCFSTSNSVLRTWKFSEELLWHSEETEFTMDKNR